MIGFVDLLLWRVRCFGIFHRPARRSLGDLRAYTEDNMVCLRCGSTWWE